MPRCLFSLLALLALLTTARPAAGATELIDPAALGFGVPAFTLDTTVQGALGYHGRSGDLELLEVRTILPVGHLERGDWLFGATLNAAWTHADLGGLRGLGRVDLETVEVTLLAAYGRADSPWWLLGFVSPGVATDFGRVGSDAFSATALGLLGYRWNAKLDLAVGVFVSYTLGEAAVLGSAGFIWRPWEKWIVQVTPPIVAIGWRPAPEWSLSAVAYPGGGAWEVSEQERVRQIELTLWRAALSVERSFGPHWRVSARAGVAFGGELELRDSDRRVLAQRDLEAAPFAAVAVKWAF